MMLGARMMNDVGGVNVFKYCTQVQVFEGNRVDVFFQLADLSVDPPSTGLNPPYRRFCPSGSASLQVTFASIDDAVTVTRNASLAFVGQDTSIWKLTIFPTDKIVGTFAMLLKLVDGGQTLFGSVQAALQVIGLQQSSC